MGSQRAACAGQEHHRSQIFLKSSPLPPLRIYDLHASIVWHAEAQQHFLCQVHAALEDYVIQPRLQTLWKEHLEGGVKSPADFGSPHQQAIFALANSYKDILHTNYPYPSR